MRYTLWYDTLGKKYTRHKCRPDWCKVAGRHSYVEFPDMSGGPLAQKLFFVSQDDIWCTVLIEWCKLEFHFLANSVGALAGPSSIILFDWNRCLRGWMVLQTTTNTLCISLHLPLNSTPLGQAWKIPTSYMSPMGETYGEGGGELIRASNTFYTIGIANNVENTRK